MDDDGELVQSISPELAEVLNDLYRAGAWIAESFVLEALGLQHDDDECSVERCGNICSCGHCSGQHHSYDGACDRDGCEKFEEML